MNKKLVALVSSVLLVSMIAVGCGNSDPKPDPAPENGETEAEDKPEADSGGEKILRSNNASEPGSLDPALAQGTHESWVLDHTFEGLMKLDQEGKVVPGMAKDYKLSDDSLTYTFTIRDDVKWSNGEPVTANDFEFAWKRAIDPDLAADYAFQIADYIKGAADYLAGEGDLEDVAIKAVEDLTLEVT